MQAVHQQPLAATLIVRHGLATHVQRLPCLVNSSCGKVHKALRPWRDPPVCMLRVLLASVSHEQRLVVVQLQSVRPELVQDRLQQR
jgi:hypothetical protein